LREKLASLLEKEREYIETGQSDPRYDFLAKEVNKKARKSKSRFTS